MILHLASIIVGLFALVWSANRFVDSTSILATHLGLPPLLIGMVVIGFGTSAPEMVVSATSAIQDSPGLALGNAYGSNITNIALVLGLTALIKPITVQSSIIQRELPVLLGATLLTCFLLWDGLLARYDAVVLLVLFAGLFTWSIKQAYDKPEDPLSTDSAEIITVKNNSILISVGWLLISLVILILSARIMVWGAVEIAKFFEVSKLVIGLTIVAIGTSLPELASSVIAARKGAHDLAIGNIIGSNMFNTLVVVGIAGSITPIDIERELLQRDITTMVLLTMLLFIFCFGLKRQGQINRIEATVLLVLYVAYNSYLLVNSV